MPSRQFELVIRDQHSGECLYLVLFDRFSVMTLEDGVTVRVHFKDEQERTPNAGTDTEGRRMDGHRRRDQN
jgi:hypothetical protein